jgi:hypothetical protein
MSLVKINMIGGGFQHDVCSSALNKNKYVDWIKDGSANISIHIDNALKDRPDPSKENYGWIAESSSIVPDIISAVIAAIPFYKQKFKYIFTHDKRIIKHDPEFFKFAPPNACPWIQQKGMYPKSKLASIIVSNKIQTNGHRFRLNVLNQLPKDKVDHFGRGFSNELPWTVEVNGKTESGKFLALKDYYFSFAFENDNYPSIFCEKLTDCFATGTIPIFWGTPDIGDYFDKDGIIFFDENFKIEELTEGFYHRKLKHVLNNLSICMDMLTSEDYIYLNYIK